MLIFNLFLIAIFFVFVIDYAGFITTIEEGLSKMISNTRQRNIHIHIPRPFSCSLCCSFWTGLIYIIVTNNFSILNLILVAAAAATTPIIAEIMSFTRDLLIQVIYWLRKLFRI